MFFFRAICLQVFETSQFSLNTVFIVIRFFNKNWSVFYVMTSRLFYFDLEIKNEN